MTQAGLRVKEAMQLGFTRCVIPQSNYPVAVESDAFELVGVHTVEEALEALIG